jgi:hypothetical protein
MARITAGIDYTFQKIAQGKPTHFDLGGPRQQEAREWFRHKAQEVTNVDAVRLISRAKSERRQAYIGKDEIGQMYTFWYDAKLKDELPFWDRLPLIFPIELYKDGFLGINLHYLPLPLRAKLMDALYTAMNNTRLDKTTRILISYRILKSASKYRWFKPCVKRYLSSHVQSRFIRIEPREWDMALMLPTERFVKARKQRVWQDSVSKLRSAGEI